MEYQQSILEPLLSALLELSTLYCTHFPCEYYFNVFPRSSMKGEMQRVGLPRYPALCVVFTAPGQAIISSYPDHGNIQTNLSTSTLASEQYILHTALHFKMQIWFCSQPSYNPSVIPHCPQDRAQIPNMVSKPTNHPGFFQFFMPHPLPPPPQAPLHLPNSFLSFSALPGNHFLEKSFLETLVFSPMALLFHSAFQACDSFISIIFWLMSVSLIWLVNSMSAGNVLILLSPEHNRNTKLMLN